MKARKLLYVVDDEAIVRSSIVSLVQAYGDYDCREFARGDVFVEALGELDRGCVVLDLQLGGVSGADALSALAQRQDDFRTIVVTGFSDLGTAMAAFRAGVVDVLHKPFEPWPLIDAIGRGFHLLDHGVEPAPLVVDARQRIARLSQNDVAVFRRLVQGDTNEQVGQRLGLDPRGVHIVRARILATLEVPSILGALRLAALAGEI